MEIEIYFFSPLFSHYEKIYALSVRAAAVVWKEGEMMKIEEIQVDPPKSNEVRIKMLFASLCHSDIIASNGFPIVCYSVSLSFFSSFIF